MRWQNVEQCLLSSLSTWNTHIRKQNITEQWIWTIHKATCNTTVPKLCYDIVMVRQSHGWSQRTNFKTWKSTHERIMIILTSSSRTKSNSCAAVQVKSAGSVVTVSLVPSQCSDTRVSNTQKTIDLEDDQMLQTHAFNFSQLLASATTTTIHNKNIRSSYQCFISFEIFWRHVGNGLCTRSDNVVGRNMFDQCIDIATIILERPRWAFRLSLGSGFFGNKGERGEMLHCYTQIHATFVFCSVKKAKNKQIMNTVQQERWCTIYVLSL